MVKNPIVTTVDFERDGVRHGHLRLPYSHDASAWGSVMIPISQIKAGDGPTVLLSGGNHGDEYEGPIALVKLARRLKTKDVAGRVIIVPAMNTPAFDAGRRLSPLDGGNLNRAFPGRPDGTATQKIADYFSTVLIPMADFVLDIHSGGKSLEFLPFAAVHRHDDAALEERCRAAMAAFGAPYSAVLREMDPAGLYDTAVEAQGKVFVTTELGGGGTARPESIAIAERGVANVLRHAGVLSGKIKSAPTAPLDMTDPQGFVIADAGGLLEPCVGLGDRLKKGDVVARVWNVTHPEHAPVSYRAGIDGLLAGRHFPSKVAAGDCIAVIAQETPIT
ncbi:N(2)-acetyl-L-2,4-diaminobutanoate deacetylase DoeB [Varunaivibrio sulfuroxidans]|uniref:N-alpha-acetyl-L-2,4-diaminobutyrate deacetylase n=1 Tax=Varunaivibrio sulfuroxidans TaxID=1773489 RepID=A0A4R3J5F8_9PROT|nr:N(2)-acetyl-L-2,4-diaminobutanoate deacetylase DoeB [Varunaivibrio sulfuroxidans]TCS60547.1 N-alpha-acetyl-L-2,4-diaminobutyrate deacetylase [Varunaivibrio sulfuroxidans]WES30037.1 N(2)-acetyl-L-2,4-diaminobutanoate deacetylase DoeB [Varunaivibrio sulfuroxidans]